MRVRYIQDEDFVNYKKPSMFIGIGTCDWKCCVEANIPITICQNCELAKMPEIDVSYEHIYQRYIKNFITNAIVIGGLEPFTQFEDICNLINYFRTKDCNDEFIIYTGYYEDEIADYIEQLSNYPNILMKFGRFKPNETIHHDFVLGVNLISNNQYAKQIS